MMKKMVHLLTSCWHARHAAFGDIRQQESFDKGCCSGRSFWTTTSAEHNASSVSSCRRAALTSQSYNLPRRSEEGRACLEESTWRKSRLGSVLRVSPPLIERRLRRVPRLRPRTARTRTCHTQVSASGTHRVFFAGSRTSCGRLNRAATST
ncbi:hypothetical protein MTO96_045881 [Rhipicephalus appendiculatus]